MGISDIFGRTDAGKSPAASAPATTGKTGSAVDATAGQVVGRLLDIGIDGRGPLDSAHQVAQTALGRHGDTEKAIGDIVNEHTKLAAAGGFITGLGGFVTLPVALPANVLGFYVLATRMSAAIAKVRGYDIDDPSVRSALLIGLVGADADDILRQAGHVAGTGRLASLATQRLPGPILMAVNKGVGFRLITHLSRTTLTRLGRGVPFVGGALGAGVDGYMIRRIASHVRTEFPPRDALTNG